MQDARIHFLQIIGGIYFWLLLSAYVKWRTWNLNMFHVQINLFFNSGFHYAECGRRKHQNPNFFKTFTPEFWVLGLHLSHLFMIDLLSRSVSSVRLWLFSLFILWGFYHFYLRFYCTWIFLLRFYLTQAQIFPGF